MDKILSLLLTARTQEREYVSLTLAPEGWIVSAYAPKSGAWSVQMAPDQTETFDAFIARALAERQARIGWTGQPDVSRDW